MQRRQLVSQDESDEFSSQDSEKKRLKSLGRNNRRKLRKQKMEFLIEMINGKEYREQKAEEMSNLFNQTVAKVTQEIQKNKYSLEPDMITGWRPGKSSLQAPLPLHFEYDVQEIILDQMMNVNQNLKSVNSKIVYLGFRPKDSYQVHFRYSRIKIYHKPILYGTLQYRRQRLKYYEKQGQNNDLRYENRKYSNTDSNPSLVVNSPTKNKMQQKRQWRISSRDYIMSYGFKKKLVKLVYTDKENHMPKYFLGMNEKYLKPDSLVFDSDFEGGNLDIVIQTGTNEYDLFMRTDSNTRGYSQWYYFSIESSKTRTIVLNMMNLTKTNCLYKKEMKPYVFDCSQEYLGWYQDEKMKVDWTTSSIFTKLKQYGMREQQLFGFKQYMRIKFSLTIQANTKYYLAYSEVYTYSMLLDDIKFLISNQGNGFSNYMKQNRTNAYQQLGDKNRQKQYRRLEQQQKLKIHVKNIISGNSLSGLVVPLVKVYHTQTKENQILKRESRQRNDKEYRTKVLVIGRVHPGEAISSLIMQGLLYQLIYDQEISNDSIEFDIVPMLNVDGVVIGNFRNSMIGKDLNRQYGNPNLQDMSTTPEVQFVQDMYEKNNYSVVVDVHGHSSKKNIFIYGGGAHKKKKDIIEVKTIAKILQNISDKCVDESYQTFNFRQTIYKLAKDKMHCCRGYFFEKGVLQSYTIEGSNMGYTSYDSKGKQFYKLFGENRQALFSFGHQVLSQGLVKMVQRHFLFLKNQKQSNVHVKKFSQLAIEQIDEDSSSEEEDKMFSDISDLQISQFEIQVIDESNKKDSQQTDQQDLEEEQQRTLKTKYYLNQRIIDQKLNGVVVSSDSERQKSRRKKKTANKVFVSRSPTKRSLVNKAQFNKNFMDKIIQKREIERINQQKEQDKLKKQEELRKQRMRLLCSKLSVNHTIFKSQPKHKVFNNLVEPDIVE